jgi:hypothetical protein
MSTSNSAWTNKEASMLQLIVVSSGNLYFVAVLCHQAFGIPTVRVVEAWGSFKTCREASKVIEEHNEWQMRQDYLLEAVLD